MESLNCDNPAYLKNLITSLEEAKQRRDVERIVAYAGELERNKILCGNSPAIMQFEQSMKRASQELGLMNNPTIERALNTTPQKLCHRCNQPEQIIRSMLGYDVVEYNLTTNTKRMVSREELETENPQLTYIKKDFPETCGSGCEHFDTQHCPYWKDNDGKPCLQRLNQEVRKQTRSLSEGY
jgi:hypothetical protein